MASSCARRNGSVAGTVEEGGLAAASVAGGAGLGLVGGAVVGVIAAATVPGAAVPSSLSDEHAAMPSSAPTTASDVAVAATRRRRSVREAVKVEVVVMVASMKIATARVVG